MKKLTLSLESLEITSFETVAVERPGRGTVRGASVVEPGTDPQVCGEFTGAAPNWCTGPDCEYTLVLTCVGSCQDCPSAIDRPCVYTDEC